MLSSTFAPTNQSFRPPLSHQNSYSFTMPGNQSLERDTANPMSPVFGNGASQIARVLINHLPATSTEESVRLLMMWSEEVADCHLLPLDLSEKSGLRSALVRFNNMAGALDARKKLDGRQNSHGDPRLAVRILSPGPFDRNNPLDQTQNALHSAPSSAGSSGPTSRQQSRFNGSFQGLDSMSPTGTGNFPGKDLPEPDATARYQQLFSAQSPIGNHLTDHSRASGKALINDDYADDDETSDLLKDPVAYAEGGSATHRRATAPYLPLIGAMTEMSINTTSATSVSSSLPPYIGSTPSPAGPLSPGHRGGPTSGFPSSGQPFQRHNFPPVNPADQNPPCNTLYVGNLPIDTSEEELKAMFSKQRGYKRLCFRTKQNGPMCFVEFEDISFATKALNELYGTPLHNSVKGGIRLSFSKNPLGVRSGQTPGPPSGSSVSGMNGMISGMNNGFTSANGPPPGLTAPPGLGTMRPAYNMPSPGIEGRPRFQQTATFGNGTTSRGWHSTSYSGNSNGEHASVPNNHGHFVPPHMMGR